MLYSSFPLATYFTHGMVCISVLTSQFIPSFPCPPCVHMSSLYVCISIPALQRGSTVPFFKIPHLCINLSYSFTLRAPRSLLYFFRTEIYFHQNKWIGKFTSAISFLRKAVRVAHHTPLPIGYPISFCGIYNDFTMRGQ